MNAQKTPLARTLSQFAQGKALDEIAKRGQALPGHVIAVSGPIVTVNFDVSGATLPQVTMPLIGAEYIRYPIQVGDKGYAAAADAYLGGVSGLGGGTADLALRGNLSALVWVPIGNKNWTVPPSSDANTLALYGKLALLLLDSIAGNNSIKLTSTGITMTAGSSTILLTPSGITLNSGGHTITIGSSGVTIDGKVFLTHEHTGVTTGGGNTGGVL
jgi:hypothetical protein